MAIGSLVPLAGMPVYQMFKFVRTPGRMRKVKKARAAGLRRGGRRHRRRDSLDPDSARESRDPGADRGQARRDLCRDPRPACRAQRPRRRMGQEGTSPGDASPTPRSSASCSSSRSSTTSTASRPVVRRDAPTPRAAPRSREHDQMAEDLEPAIEKIDDQIGKLTARRAAGRPGRSACRTTRRSASSSSRASRSVRSATLTSSKPT